MNITSSTNKRTTHEWNSNDKITTCWLSWYQVLKGRGIPVTSHVIVTSSPHCATCDVGPVTILACSVVKIDF